MESPFALTMRYGQAPELSKRRNIIVIADEAHRSQSDLIDGLELRGLEHKNVAADSLAKPVGDEIEVRSKWNLVQSPEFSAATNPQQRPGFRMLKL